MTELIKDDGRVTGVRLSSGTEVTYPRGVLVAAGNITANPTETLLISAGTTVGPYMTLGYCGAQKQMTFLLSPISMTIQRTGPHPHTIKQDQMNQNYKQRRNSMPLIDI